MTEQPMYYENAFEGKWKHQISDDYIGYQLAAFALVLIVSLSVITLGIIIGVNRNSWVWVLFFPVIVLDLIFLFMEYDAP